MTSAGPWKMESQRAYFGKALVELGRRNPKVVVVGADTTESIKSIDFGKVFPDRFVQLGIAEPNMISVAAGLAAAGKIAFACTYSVFGSAHTYNIVRQNVAYTRLDVKIFSSHAGLTVGPDGATHQINEDIGLMRGIPRMTVLVPADGPQTAKCVDAAAETKGPVYCRFSRTNVPTITSTDDDFGIGKAYVLRDGSDLTLVGSGLMVARCLQAAEALAVGVGGAHADGVLDADFRGQQREPALAVLLLDVAPRVLGGDQRGVLRIHSDSSRAL